MPERDKITAKEHEPMEIDLGQNSTANEKVSPRIYNWKRAQEIKLFTKRLEMTNHYYFYAKRQFRAKGSNGFKIKWSPKINDRSTFDSNKLYSMVNVFNGHGHNKFKQIKITFNTKSN